MKFRKLNTGNYLGYYLGYYFFAYRKAHGGWCCRIGKRGEWLYSEGKHGSSLPTVKKLKWWVKEMLTNPKFKTRVYWDKIWKGTENAALIPS